MDIQKVDSAKPIAQEQVEQVSERVSLAVLQELSKSLETLESPDTAQAASKKVSVGSRPLSAESQQILANRPRPQKQKTAQIGPLFNFPVDIVSSDLRNHFLASYSLFDNTIELEDGSFWKIPSREMYKVLSWALNDELMITPNQWLHSGYYLISNRTTGDSIGADLIVGPEEYGVNTHWIIGIDRWLGRVYLENGTYWDVRGFDQNLLSDWEVNDTIILGDGANEWIGRHDSILINVNLNHYVFANREI